MGRTWITVFLEVTTLTLFEANSRVENQGIQQAKSHDIRTHAGGGRSFELLGDFPVVFLVLLSAGKKPLQQLNAKMMPVDHGQPWSSVDGLSVPRLRWC